MHATCFTNLILPDFIALITSVKEQKNPPFETFSCGLLFPSSQFPDVPQYSVIVQRQPVFFP
jgi:hypothetical protein